MRREGRAGSCLGRGDGEVGGEARRRVALARRIACSLGIGAVVIGTPLLAAATAQAGGLPIQWEPCGILDGWWYCGPTGNSGSTGPTGPAGAAGPTGAKGAAGPTGVAGATGAQGPEGLPGAEGASAGKKGDTGPTGGAGNQGPRGATGETGKEGGRGAQGGPGNAGANGGPELRARTARPVKPAKTRSGIARNASCPRRESPPPPFIPPPNRELLFGCHELEFFPGQLERTNRTRFLSQFALGEIEGVAAFGECRLDQVARFRPEFEP